MNIAPIQTHNKLNQLALTISSAYQRIITTIVAIVKEIFLRLSFLFSSIPTHQRAHFNPISQTDLHQNLLPAALTAATCKQDDASWATCFGARSLDLSPYLKKLPQGFAWMADKHTLIFKDLAIIVKVYETDSKRFICFGSKSAILNLGLDHVEKTSKDVFKMGLKASLGFEAPFFKPVVDLADFFVSETPFFQDEKPTKFIGHSYGATLAEIAAIHTTKEAICFAPFQLGFDCQYKLGKDKLEKATNHIKIIFVDKDWLKSKWVSAIQIIYRLCRLRFPNNFGNHLVMPSAYNDSQKSHDYLLGSYMKALGHDIRTKPSQIDLTPYLDPKGP